MQLVADISRWQGLIDWAKLKSSAYHGMPISAVIIKAGGNDGGRYADQAFARNRAGAESVGLPWAPYFFGQAQGSTDSAKGDAEFFASLFAASPLPPVLDIEQAVIAADAASAWTCAFQQRIIDRTSRRPVTYSYGDPNRIFTDCEWLRDSTDLWVASYVPGTDPIPPIGAPGPRSRNWARWTMWQFTSFAHLDGIPANSVDLNLCDPAWLTGHDIPSPIVATTQEDIMPDTFMFPEGAEYVLAPCPPPFSDTGFAWVHIAAPIDYTDAIAARAISTTNRPLASGNDADDALFGRHPVLSGPHVRSTHD